MPAAPDLRTLAGSVLDARLRDLQARAFAIYEAAAQAAERGDLDAYPHAEREAAPLIAQAQAFNDERVRRFRARARRWRIAAIVIGVLGAALVAWLALR